MKKEDKAISGNKAAIFLSLYTFFLSVLEIFYRDKYAMRKLILKNGNWEPDKIYFRVMLIMCVKIKEIKVA